MTVFACDRYGDGPVSKEQQRGNAKAWYKYMIQIGWTPIELNILMFRVEVATKQISINQYPESDWLPRRYRGEAD